MTAALSNAVLDTLFPETEDPMQDVIDRARAAQVGWGQRSLSDRLARIARFRRLLVDRADEALESIELPQRSPGETIAAEVLPLADACRYMELYACRVLQTRAVGRRGRPLWCAGTRIRISREPHGVVLILGPSNYPLMLPGVQLLQALAAGNAVLLKPGRRSSSAARLLLELCIAAGIPTDLVALLPEELGAYRAALAAGVDFVTLTGSSSTGRRVLADLSETLTPAVMELSGCDAVFVMASANLDIAARAVAFGLMLNGGATCLSPRRLFIAPEIRQDFVARLVRRLQDFAPTVVEAGAAARVIQTIDSALAEAAVRLCGEPSPSAWQAVVLDNVQPEMPVARSDLFAPVTCVMASRDLEEAVEWYHRCPYQLGASVFGAPDEAATLADRLRAGSVVINDLIAPTADPRAPFPAWGESGYGVTRGAEGLLAMTRVKATIEQRSRWLPHLDVPGAPDLQQMRHLLQFTHGSDWLIRIRGLWGLIKSRKPQSAATSPETVRKV